MELPFGPDSKIAFVPRGGPENGPFSAMACRIISEILAEYGYKVSGIYTSSGSTPTALMGCIGDYPRLCHIWANLTPKNVVGKMSTMNTIFRVIMKNSILTSHFLENLIESNWDLKKIFSPDAIPIKFQAVDIFSREIITFSNKDPRHEKYFLQGVMGAMGIVPFLEPQIIFNPKDSGLIDENLIQENALLLVDGGYKSNMMLETAMRDGFDVIFVIDVHGLKPTLNKFTPKDLDSAFAWAKLLRNCFHLLTNSNDIKQFQLTERANEEIAIRDSETEVLGLLTDLFDKLPPEYQKDLNPIIDYQHAIIDRMNNDRLRLGDKKRTKIIMVSNEAHSTLFNFAKFKPQEPMDLLNAGWIAAVDTMKSLGFNVSSAMPVERKF